MTDLKVDERITQAEADGFENWTDGMFWVPDSDNQWGAPEGLVVCPLCDANGYYASGWRHANGAELWLHQCSDCGHRWIGEVSAHDRQVEKLVGELFEKRFPPGSDGPEEKFDMGDLYAEAEEEIARRAAVGTPCAKCGAPLPPDLLCDCETESMPPDET